MRLPKRHMGKAGGISYKVAKNRYFIAFVVTFSLILFEFTQFLSIGINNNVLMFAAITGLIGAGVTYSKGHGKLHFGVVLFFLGFIMILVAGVPLFGGAEMFEHEAYWTIGDNCINEVTDEEGNYTQENLDLCMENAESKKVPLAIFAFGGAVLIFINFKAYMGSWVFARPMGR